MQSNFQRAAVFCFACIMLPATPGLGQQAGFREGVAKPFKVVTMSASLREVITSIHVVEGDRITAGQVLVNLEVEKEKLAAERTEQLIAKAHFDYNASKRLFEQNVSSKDDMLS